MSDRGFFIGPLPLEEKMVTDGRSAGKPAEKPDRNTKQAFLYKLLVMTAAAWIRELLDSDTDIEMEMERCFRDATFRVAEEVEGGSHPTVF